MTTFGPYQATIAAIHDGDTVDVDLVLIPHIGHLTQDHDLGFNVHRKQTGVVLEKQSVRLYGCNAPELSTAAGKASLAYLQTLLKVGDVITLLSHGWDKYGGRIDGQVTLADGRDLVTVMITAGQAFAWSGVGVKPT